MSFEIPFSHIAEIIMGQSPKGEEVNNEGIGLPLLNGPTEFTDRYPAPVQHTAYAKKYRYQEIFYFVFVVQQPAG
ncbi:hypothetical protein [Enterobacter hormaechei]|jgi:type I restriction enzyme S subunit|uniref:hypothetical protein n=1 Tax=Enterobacter hormaechei TaxID=158836 RepID=UPI003525F89F